MALTLPNGSSLAIASTYAASKAMSAITNASEAVATLEADHGVAQNDIFQVTSGWGDLDGRIVRAKTVVSNSVTFEGIDTTNTTRFPAGSGIGQVREISAWTAITQIMGFETSGGDQQFFEYQFLEGFNQRQIPTVRSPLQIDLTLGDDPSLPWYAAIKAASDSREPRALRLTLPNGAILYYNGVWSLQESPAVTANEALTLACTVALVAPLTRY